MASPTTSDPDNETNSSAPEQKIVTNPDFSGTPTPIAEWTQRPDFPQCALGAYVSIRGFEGVVVEIIGQSMRIVSTEGVKQRFNGDRLKTLFAPRERPQPTPEPKAPPAKQQAQPDTEEDEEEEDDDDEVVPTRQYIANPDFTAPVCAIGDYAKQADFPRCAYGKYVSIAEYAGVVVEIVKDSVRVQCESGGIRRFNAPVLRKLYSPR